MEYTPLQALDAALPGPGKPPSSLPVPDGHETRGPTGYDVEDFHVGQLVQFKANGKNFCPIDRYAAPTGALARVTSIEPDNWPGTIGVDWVDQWAHGQTNGGYYACMFWPAHPDIIDPDTAPDGTDRGVQLDIFDMLAD